MSHDHLWDHNRTFLPVLSYGLNNVGGIFSNNWVLYGFVGLCQNNGVDFYSGHVMGSIELQGLVTTISKF